MARTIEKTLFQFAELNDAAKERARDWYRSVIELDDIADYADWSTVACILGINFDTHTVRLMGGSTREELKVYWSASSSQGDGASFEGFYTYTKGAAKRIREYAPQDTVLHRIADELQQLQRRHFYRLSATMGRGIGSNFYSHSGTMSVETDDGNYGARGADELSQLMRDFADWIYARVRDQVEYLYSAEAVDESIAANDYEFSDDGAIA